MSERPQMRDRVNEMVKQMVKAGSSVEYAKKKAIQAAKKADRKNTK